MSDSIFRKLFVILIVVMAFLDVKLQAAVEEKHMNQYVERCLERTAAVFSMEENTENEISQNEKGESGQESRMEESGRNENVGDSQGTVSENQAGAADHESESAPVVIRVLLTGGQGYAHHDFMLSFEEDYYIQNGQEVYYGEAGTSITEEDIASLFARQSEMKAHAGNVQSNGQSIGEEDGLIVGIWRDGDWDTDAEWKLSMD
ncbi:MAG: hypothetical protein K2K17_07915, partial [Lachnospiraceae bacterium]|nr:hypothetical protein [Lachnospiraceae bacterium]